ncbi:MAG: multidrug ABC transporter, partial [Eggerthellaceae bacterium]|nr:multidrug ABC transporter [Eggerthellaceae bacterium]
MLPYVAVYLLGVFISAVSQVLLKKEALKPHESVVAEYLNLRVIVAYAIFFTATLMTIYAYKAVPLSLGPILEATSYLYVMVFGAVFFSEKPTKLKVAAIILILAGLSIYASG